MQLNDKVAVITGAAGEIGAEAVRRFLEAGARVLAVDRDEGALAERTEALGSQGVATVVADVTVEADMAELAETARSRFGRVDCFLANAGVEGRVGPTLLECTLEAFERVQRINVTGVFLGVKHLAPLMPRGGAIVITSSVAGLRGSAGLGPYCTSKHAVVGLMRSLAVELGGAGIRVNTVNPGPIRSRMMSSLESGLAADDPAVVQGLRDAMAARIPLGRYGEPAEVAELMLFLCSDAARYLNGGTYTVDGGLTAS